MIQVLLSTRPKSEGFWVTLIWTSLLVCFKRLKFSLGCLLIKMVGYIEFTISCNIWAYTVDVASGSKRLYLEISAAVEKTVKLVEYFMKPKLTKSEAETRNVSYFSIKFLV